MVDCCIRRMAEYHRVGNDFNEAINTSVLICQCSSEHYAPKSMLWRQEPCGPRHPMSTIAAVITFNVI